MTFISSIRYSLMMSFGDLPTAVCVADERYLVGQGVTVGEGAVVCPRAVVVKNVEPWTVVGGNPAKFIKKRIIKENL